MGFVCLEGQVEAGPNLGGPVAQVAARLVADGTAWISASQWRGRDVLRGSVRFWPISVGGHQELLLGPLAVQSDQRGRGIGIALMQAGIAAAQQGPWRGILLIGAFELKNNVEIPYRVVINEAVELAKSFGGIDGHKYVNGVLDKLAAKFREDEVASKRR